MALIVSVILAVFGRAVLGGVFYIGDIFQLHLPLRVAYAAELARGSLPLWSADVMGGYPLLAEGQLGALYPPNIILHLLLPVPVALNGFILLHYIWAALGTYAFARRLRLIPAAAVLTALVYGLGGFLVAHLNHVNIVASASWLPWTFLFADRLLADASGSKRSGSAALLAVSVGMGFLAGHPQVALLSLVAVAAYSAYLLLTTRQRSGSWGWLIAALVVGVALSAAQLLPTYELTGLSERAGGLDPDFFTSFSLHPLYLVSLVLPFIRGQAYPELSVELVGYVGLLPLILALLAPFVALGRARDGSPEPRRARFLAGLAVVALLLSFGRYNPLYMALLRVPLFNLFRVPGRYLYWFAFSAAVLAGFGLHALLGRGENDSESTSGGPSWRVVGLTALVAVAAAARVQSVHEWLAAWRWLPIVLGLLTLGWLIWAWRSKGMRQSALATAALALVILDLVAFNAVFNLSYNDTMPVAELTAEPRSLSWLQAGTGIYRVYTQEKIVPWLSVMRESYYPNLALLHGLASANGQFPLLLKRYSQYTSAMTPSMLNLLGVKYYLIPQVLPVDAASESYDLADPFAYDPLDKLSPTPGVNITSVEIESYLTRSVDWKDGDPLALVTVVAEEQDQTVEAWLSVGSHSSEWAYDRSDVIVNVRHAKATVARTFPARSGYPAEDHPGYVYRATMRLPYPILAQGLELTSYVKPSHLHIERVTLYDENGNAYLIAHLEGKGDHSLVYRSEDVVVYQNNDVLPRIFMTYQARGTVDDTETLSILQSREFDPRREVLVAGESVAPVTPPVTGAERVELLSYGSQRVTARVLAPADGYLVLTDTWYPGWHVWVDGVTARLERADLIFRAVHLTAGEHEVEFVYAPASFRSGGIISLLALLLIATGLLLARRGAAPGQA